jgi:hypothetical protein
LKIQPELEINKARFGNGALILNRALILGKIGRRFNRQGTGKAAVCRQSKVDRLG